MRKYDIKNKRNIGIIIGISIIIIIMFSLVIKLFLSRDKNLYTVITDTIVFDKDKTIIKLKNDGIIRTKWNNEYYLIYNDNNYELGKSSITFNEETGEIHLYGKYYEINSDDKINVTSGETIIKNSLLTKFYKLDDRKYLVIDNEIKSSDGLISTTDFLIIELDKAGNATLTNHKVNLKTFSETVIVTSNYTFDISNEILSYGNDKIDLKKIIGSSNEYTKGDLEPEENTKSNIDSSNNNAGVITGNNTDYNNINENNQRNTTVIEEAKKAAKNTSLISVTSSFNKIVVDYVVYDPNNEYSKVYLEINDEYGNTEIVYLNKNDTTYEIGNNIYPNAKYSVTLKYSYIDEDTLDEKTESIGPINITIKKPIPLIKVTRTSFGKITYNINVENGYKINAATLIVNLNGSEYSRGEISINSDNNYTVGEVNIPSIEDGDTVELNLVNFKVDGVIIKDLTSSYRFRY